MLQTGIRNKKRQKSEKKPEKSKKAEIPKKKDTAARQSESS
jgi:hypothetical protein